MAHPLKNEAASAHTAKLRSMTSHYGLASGPANNITSPQERLKGEGGEKSVGFGADSDMASARSDRPARRTQSANPIATYARGGKVKHRDDGGRLRDFYDITVPAAAAKLKGQSTAPNPKYARGGKVKHKADGGDVSPIEEANKNQAEASPKAAGGVIARAKGGRTKAHKGATHVNVVVAPQGGNSPMPGGPMAGPSPQLAALAAPPHPPMMPPPGAGGPPGAPPMAGPPPGGPPMMPRKKGGRVMGGHPSAGDMEEAATRREEGLVEKARGGGITMHAGAVTGIGRLEKMGKHPPLHKGSMKPQEI